MSHEHGWSDMAVLHAATAQFGYLHSILSLVAVIPMCNNKLGLDCSSSGRTQRSTHELVMHEPLVLRQVQGCCCASTGLCTATHELADIIAHQWSRLIAGSMLSSIFQTWS